MEQFSDRLVFYRKLRNLTQQQVADRLGIDRRNYAKYETGERIPKDEILAKLSKILDCTCDNLISGEKLELIDILNFWVRNDVLSCVDNRYSDAGYELYTEYMNDSRIFTQLLDGLKKEIETDSEMQLIVKSHHVCKLADLLQEQQILYRTDPARQEAGTLLKSGEQTLLYKYSVVFVWSVHHYLAELPNVQKIIDESRSAWDMEDRTDQEVYQKFIIHVFVRYATLLIDTFSDSYFSFQTNQSIMDTFFLACH